MNFDEYKSFILKYPVMEDWFGKLPEKAFANCDVSYFPHDKVIFSKDDEIRYVYFVCSGVVTISNIDVLGNEINVVFVQEGSIIGELEVILKKNRFFFGVKAYSDSVLFRMPVADFSYIISTYPDFANRLSETLAQKVYLSSVRIIQYGQIETVSRLKLLLENYPPGRIMQTRKELAMACGVTERTMQRAVQSLCDNGLLSIERGKIVLSEEQLRHIKEDNRRRQV